MSSARQALPERHLSEYRCLRFRKAGYQAINRICDHYHTMQDKPVKPSVEPGYLRKALPCEFNTPFNRGGTKY